MLNIVTFVKALFDTITSFLNWKHDEALRDDGAAKADLKGRQEADEISSDITDARNDQRVRDETESKYYRD